MSIFTEMQANSAVVRRFEEAGYVVTIEPPLEEIPFDLGGYRPDLLAVKPGDNVIVEVNRPGSRKTADLYLRISDAAASHPGWSFKLVTLPDHFDDAPDRSAGSIDDIRQVLKKVDQITGQPDFASFSMIPLWSAYASALRLWVGRNSGRANLLTDMGLMNLAYSSGLIDFEDFEETRRLYTIRNQAVKELGTKISVADIVSLRDKTSRILEQLGSEDTDSVAGD